MLLEQTAAEEDLSAPGLSMTAGSKSVLISVNQCHRWFYNSYKGLRSFQFSGVLTEARRARRVGGVEFSMLNKQVIQITSEFFAREIIRSMKMYEVFKFE